MINNFFKKYIYIILLIAFSFMVVIYAQNQELLVFNQIEIKNNSDKQNVTEELLFDYINYNSDSINFYSSKDYKHFSEKIKSLKGKNSIIKNVNYYYSLPNKIIFDIEERKLSYLIKNKNDSLFILDDLGMIRDVDFLSVKIPEVELIFNDFYIYNIFNDGMKVNEIFKDIKKNKLNNECFLDALEILNSFNKLGLANQIDSVIIDSHHHGDLEAPLSSYIYTITVNDLGAEILFNQNENLKKQIKKFEIFINTLNQNIDQLTFNNISDLQQIRLDIDEQIVYKEK